MAEVCYSIKQLGHGFYRVARYFDSFNIIDHSQDKHSDVKLASSLSRSRRLVFELAMCNPWQYFFTGTLDSSKYDRYDLDKFHKDITRFFRDKDIKFVVVPERHDDGAWHVHGLLNNVSDEFLSFFDPSIHPLKLVNKGYLNFPAYADKFGFCSLGKIKSPVGVSYYITKYISKSLLERSSELHGRLYYNSRGLMYADSVAQIYGFNAILDSIVEPVNEFVASGLVKGKDWTFPLDFMSNAFIPQLDIDYHEYSEIDEYMNFEQLLIDMGVSDEKAEK